MNIKRILLGKVSVYWAKWQKWDSLYCQKYWAGRIFTLSISKLHFTLDCRINWIEDMITGDPR